jgi:hypothetical protein
MDLQSGFADLYQIAQHNASNSVALQQLTQHMVDNVDNAGLTCYSVPRTAIRRAPPLRRNNRGRSWS